MKVLLYHSLPIKKQELESPARQLGDYTRSIVLIDSPVMRCIDIAQTKNQFIVIS